MSALQRTVGNAAVGRLLARATPQPESVDPRGRILPAEFARVAAKLRADERLNRAPRLQQPSRELAEITGRCESLAYWYRDLARGFDDVLTKSKLGPDRDFLDVFAVEDSSRSRAFEQEERLERLLEEKSLNQIRAGENDVYQRDQLEALSLWLAELELAIADLRDAARTVARLDDVQRGTVDGLLDSAAAANRFAAEIGTTARRMLPLTVEPPDLGEVTLNALALIPLDVVSVLFMTDPQHAAEIDRIRRHLRPIRYRSAQQERPAQALEIIFSGLVEGVLLDVLTGLRVAGGARAITAGTSLAEEGPELARLRALLWKPEELEAALSEIDNLGDELLRAAKTLPSEEASDITARVARGREITARLRAEAEEVSFATASEEAGLDAPGKGLAVPSEWAEADQRLENAVQALPQGSRRRAVAEIHIDPLPNAASSVGKPVTAPSHGPEAWQGDWTLVEKAGEKGNATLPRSDITTPEQHILTPNAYERPRTAPGTGIPPGMSAAKKETWLKKHAVVPGERDPHPFSRANDAEAKLLKRIEARLPRDPALRRQITGVIHLRPTHEPCQACIDAVHRFRGTFPGIQIVLH